MEKGIKFPKTITKDGKEYTFVKQCNNFICLYHRFINGIEMRECFNVQELGFIKDMKSEIQKDNIPDGSLANLPKPTNGRPIIVQKLNKKMKLVKVYPSVRAAADKEEKNGLSKSGITLAIRKGRLYKGYYWRGVRNGEIG